jgi:hypothetical protein
MVDPPSQPRRAIIFGWRAFASSSALHIFRFAGSSQANQHVTRRAKGRHLACENFIEAIFVARGNGQSAIACETKSPDYARRPLGETHYEFCRKLCGIGRAPTVPANKQFVPRAQTLFD